MKKVILCALAACTVMLCSCEQKNSSMLTESQAETTTKATSLTIASQSATATTEFRVTTTTRDPENTVFTSNDGYHTALEGKTEIMEFCKFIVKNWAKVYDGGEDFDFSPYCRYGELARYLDYTAKHGAKAEMFSDTASVGLAEMAYYESNGSVKIQALYYSPHSTQGDFYFVVQSVDGKLVLSDMFFDRMDSIDLIVRPGERFNLEFWAKTGRCDELVKRYEEKEATFTVSDSKTLKDADKEKISGFCSYIADGWAGYVSGNWNEAFFRYFKYSDLRNYIAETEPFFAVDGGKYFDADKTDLKIESIKLDGVNAVVTGTYENYRREQVKLVIIVENVGGHLQVSDIICGQKDMPDSMYRPEQVKKLMTEYWAQVGKLAELEKKMGLGDN